MNQVEGKADVSSTVGDPYFELFSFGLARSTGVEMGDSGGRATIYG